MAHQSPASFLKGGGGGGGVVVGGGGEIESRRNSPTGVSEPRAAAGRRRENLNTAKSGKRLFDFL